MACFLTHGVLMAVSYAAQTILICTCHWFLFLLSCIGYAAAQAILIRWFCWFLSFFFFFLWPNLRGRSADRHQISAHVQQWSRFIKVGQKFAANTCFVAHQIYFMAVSKLGCSELFFVEPGVKSDGRYYWDVLHCWTDVRVGPGL